MAADERIKIKTGATVLSNEDDAVQELFEKIYQPGMEGVIFFCSSRYDTARLGDCLKKAFPCTLIGCTTSGEISSCGYQQGGIVASSISSSEVKLHPHIISPLKGFGLREAQRLASKIKEELKFSDRFQKDKMFGFLMIDGLSAKEENIIAALYDSLGWISIIGGSAGDDMRLMETKVYSDGMFISDAAVFTLIETTLPFYTFKTHHFVPTKNKVVITSADPSRRIVNEINGEPAAQEYADILGLKVSDLNLSVFCRHPLMLKIGDGWYVRSIQKINDDGGLSFFCAIDNGLVMTLGECENIIKDFKELFNRISKAIPNPSLIIGCDCESRKRELTDKGLTEEIRNLLMNINFIGFNTYGEQFDSVHVNQTLTGVAIGA